MSLITQGTQIIFMNILMYFLITYTLKLFQNIHYIKFAIFTGV